MMFFFKGRSVIVAAPAPEAAKPEISIAGIARNMARARLRLEDADTSGALRRDRQTVEDNRLL
jgi:hypothetical protein